MLGAEASGQLPDLGLHLIAAGADLVERVPHFALRAELDYKLFDGLRYVVYLPEELRGTAKPSDYAHGDGRLVNIKAHVDLIKLSRLATSVVAVR